MNDALNLSAGIGPGTLPMGGLQFAYDPTSIAEYMHYMRLPMPTGADTEAQCRRLEIQAEWLSGVLRKRVLGTVVDPATITPEWVLDRCPAKDLGDIITTYLNGEKPQAGGEKKEP